MPLHARGPRLVFSRSESSSIVAYSCAEHTRDEGVSFSTILVPIGAIYLR
jgi:hypothetical protein